MMMGFNEGYEVMVINFNYDGDYNCHAPNCPILVLLIVRSELSCSILS